MAKKTTNIEGTAKKSTKDKVTKSTTEFKASPEAKSKALMLRIVAVIAFLFAIGFQIVAIFYLVHIAEDINIWIPIGLLILDFAAAIFGGYFWKKSNKIDPPSEKNKILFFIQSQLGLLVALIAFLPLIIYVLFFDKKLKGQQKTAIVALALVLMAGAGFLGYEFDPASVEKYTAQTQLVQGLTGQNLVYGTKSGTKFHLYEDCPHLKAVNVDVFKGTVADLHEHNHRIGTGDDSLCETCRKRALKAKLEQSTTDEERQALEQQINSIDDSHEGHSDEE